MQHIKFETKSYRVKGLCFHPTRPWLLASLHNGTIQLWDYRIRCLLDKFEEHFGPVRSVSFHPVQPLFASGGDDFSIKVWNYKQRKCLFTLLGHLDYVRTVQFHPGDCPWLLSASDDQTIRIWNWQSRQCISILTGHNHYVMSAQFHPREDLVVSASLDQTVRVWDISGLRKKNSQPMNPVMAARLAGRGGGGDADAARLQNDLFGTNDALIKYVLESHERGVNWATFHPTQPLIASSADDRLVKLWRISDTQAWEVDSFRGHFHNVSCCVFHPRYDVVLSDSEDKTIRAWDLNKRTCLQTFRREKDRFWVLAVHPTQNFVAAGHDSGLVLFKLVSERVPTATAGNQFIYVAGNSVRGYDMASGRDVPLCLMRPKTALAPLMQPPAEISFSASDRCFVCSYKGDGGHYELYALPSDANRGSEAKDVKKGTGLGAVFVGRKRFAVLDKKQLVIRDTTNAEIKRVPLPANADWVFPGPAVGTVLLRMEDRLGVFDISQRKMVAEAVVPGVRHVVWAPASQHRVALLSKDHVTVCNARLEVLASVHEMIRPKSAAWDDHGVLIYATQSHIKFVLPQNGDCGVVRAIDAPLYIAGVRGNKVFCVDREGQPRVIAVNPTEYMFKLALAEKRFADVLRMVRDANLVGSALVGYLQKRGYPEIALHFVRDERLRFELAVECGNIDIALEAARAVNEPPFWKRLAEAALVQGNHQIVEMAYQRIRDFARLSFLYTVTGNTDKLRKMLKIADMRSDVQSVFHNALYLGDVEERAKVLAAAGLPQLAYVVAASHGLEDAAEAYARQIEQACPDAELPGANPTAQLLLPPVPIVRAGDCSWPLLNVSKSWTENLLASSAGASSGAAGAGADSGAADAKFAAAVDDADEAGDAWGDADITEPGVTGGAEGEEGGAFGAGAAETGAGATGAGEEPELGEGEGWDMEGDMDALKDLDALPGMSGGAGGSSSGGSGEYFVPPVAGTSVVSVWPKNSRQAVDHAAAGALESAVRLLREQRGIASVAPLRERFVDAFLGAQAYVPGLAGAPAVLVPLNRNELSLEATGSGRLAGLPAVAGRLSVAELAAKLREAYGLFTRGHFKEALAAFRGLFALIVCADSSTRQDADELAELAGICREYVLALAMELRRRELAAQKAEPQRQMELAAYLTHCRLQLPHLVLVLRAAMNAAFANKNYLTAAGFARRLLDLSPKQDIAAMAHKVCQFADANPANAFVLDYDEHNPFVPCAFALAPIYRGSPVAVCPFCGASATPDHVGQCCPVCELASISNEGR